MSQPTNQREKASAVIQVCVTPTEKQKLIEAANESTRHRSFSDWGRETFVQPYVRKLDKRKSGSQ